MEGLIRSVYIHTEAANKATDIFGEVSVTASDVLNNIHKAFRRE
jgi:hypothetical protein